MNEIEELKKQYYKLDEEIASLDVSQSSYKVAANSAYGILNLPYFKYYDPDMAEAITTTGQVSILKSKEILDDIFSKLNKEIHNYVTYCDTDSVGGDSLVYLNGSKIKISELYDMLSNNYISKDDDKKSYVKSCAGVETLAYDQNTEKVVSSKIKYVMKHKVNKRMFKLTVNGKSVTVTQDHSLIVFRNGCYLKVSPLELMKNDKILNILTQEVSVYGEINTETKT